MVKRPVGLWKSIFHRRGRKWRPYLAIAILLLASYPFYHAFTSFTPDIEYPTDQVKTIPALTFTIINYKTHTSVPLTTVPAKFWVVVRFTAAGAFSVNNPVKANIWVIAPNITDNVFLRDYGVVAFTNASLYPPPTTRPVNLNLTSEGVSTHIINGIPETGSVFSANATFVWKQVGPTWIYFAPATNPLIEDDFIASRYLHGGDSILTISDVGDTLSVNSNNSTLFLTWVLVGFSVLMLQPILEAILLEEDDRPKSSGQPQLQQEQVQRAK